MSITSDNSARSVAVHCAIRPTEAELVRDAAIRFRLTPSNLCYILLRQATQDFTNFDALNDPTIRAIGNRKPAVRVRWDHKLHEQDTAQ